MGYHRHRWLSAELLRSSRLYRWKKRKKAVSKPDKPDKIQQFARSASDRLTVDATAEEVLVRDRLSELGIRHYFQYPFVSKRKCVIVDFAIPRGKRTFLVVEIDGGYHLTDKQKDKDQKRTIWIHEHTGAEVIRFTNEEVTQDLDLVIKEIIAKL